MNQKKLPLFILFVLLSFSGCQKQSDSWSALIQNDITAGWSFDIKDGSSPHSIYKIKDGHLIVHGKKQSQAVIQTKKDYQNFELKFEWRWLDEPGNSGCLIYCSTPRHLSVWPKSLEVQLQSGNAGDLIHIGETIEVPEVQIPQNLPEKSWKHRLRHNLTDDSEKASGEWNLGHIIAVDGEVTVFVNDELVNKGTNVSARMGKICFQAEGANLEFRNIEIMEK